MHLEAGGYRKYSYVIWVCNLPYLGREVWIRWRLDFTLAANVSIGELRRSAQDGRQCPLFGGKRTFESVVFAGPD